MLFVLSCWSLDTEAELDVEDKEGTSVPVITPTLVFLKARAVSKQENYQLQLITVRSTDVKCKS